MTKDEQNMFSKFCVYCQKHGHTDDECWCTRAIPPINPIINHDQTMTTNTTNSQAASIDTPEFRQLLKDYSFYGIERGTPPLIAHIDAKLAQAREEGRRDSHETNVTMLNLKLKAEDRAAIAEDAWRAEKARADEAEEWLNTEKEFSHSMEQRAITAESRLAEIQRGIKALKTQRRRARILGTNIMNEEYFFYVGDVLALLQPQGQAATTMMRTELPQGWKLVPVEPTEEMMDSCRGGFITALAMPAFVAAYKTMVESAPQTLQTKDGLYVLDNLSTKADDEGKIINDTSGLPG